MTQRKTISVEEFFGPPARAKVTLSPDGTRMAYLALWKNRMNVWIESVDALGGRSVRDHRGPRSGELPLDA
ncbi:hypothetical protein [Streptomyces niveus]|uniref:hypothetical protein n=1 Tax=Streptomyces niveus TaxID=193462 RepID=UPI00379700EF